MAYTPNESKTMNTIFGKRLSLATAPAVATELLDSWFPDSGPDEIRREVTRFLDDWLAFKPDLQVKRLSIPLAKSVAPIRKTYKSVDLTAERARARQLLWLANHNSVSNQTLDRWVVKGTTVDAAKEEIARSVCRAASA